MLAELDRATFSNIEHQSLEFVIHTMTPWVVRLEQSYNLNLLWRYGIVDRFYEHLMAGLLRGDLKSRYEAYAIGRGNGWLSANDVRELENMNPIGPQGDIYLIPMNMVDASGPNPDPERDSKPEAEPESKKKAESEKKGVSDRGESRVAEIEMGSGNIENPVPVARDRIVGNFQPLFCDAAIRIVNREAIALKRAVKKYLVNDSGRQSRDNTGFESWVEEFYGSLPDYIQRAFESTIMAFSTEIREAVEREIGESAEGVGAGGVGDLAGDIEERVKGFVEQYLWGLCTRYSDESKRKIEEILADSDLGELVAERIEKVADEWRETRPESLATNETHRLANGIAMTVIFVGGGKVYWRCRGSKTCPYCRSLEGKGISQGGEGFVQKGQEFMPDGTDKPMTMRSTKHHPPLHRGCDCFIAAK